MKARKTAKNTLRMMRREISYGGHAKWSGSGYILKVKLIGFVMG